MMPKTTDRAGTPQGVFGAELRHYRTQAGLSQADLAARTHVSHDVISKIETGERPPADGFPSRLDAVAEPGAEDDRVGQQVAARLARQEILARRDPPHLWCVLDEGVLHRGIGGPEVMRAQLAHLAEAAARPRVCVQVVPFSAGAHPGLLANFIIADFDGSPSIVYLETATTGRVAGEPSELTRATLVFDSLRGEALPRRASADLIVKVAEERWS